VKPMILKKPVLQVTIEDNIPMDGKEVRLVLYVGDMKYGQIEFVSNEILETGSSDMLTVIVARVKEKLERYVHEHTKQKAPR
jgi:hypothetical protein